LLDELAIQCHVVFLITDDREGAASANRVFEISDGLVVSDTARVLSGPLYANPAALQAVDMSKRVNEGSGNLGYWKGELL
ncbi:macrolide ABC transporter permease/ATP-binding protein MacB, partial [Pseudomonas syringae pv. tagetis]